MILIPNRLNIIIDGQFGSTGKGLVASYIGSHNHIDLAITNASPNAAHTFFVGQNRYITRHLPVTGILNENSNIYLCAGAIIDPLILLKELDHFNCKKRVFIHPRAAVVEKTDIEFEKEGAVKKIASTRLGVGSALSRKVNRSAKLAESNSLLRPMIKELNVSGYLKQNRTAVMEVPQGLDLSINSGLSYPHCTSREITISSALSDAQVHPSCLGNVIVCIRTFPIRVGHILENNRVVGNSGPFYNDSTETSWEEIGVDKEYTTNTKRVRRVASFSMVQYQKMLDVFKPNYIFLNFANYLSREKLSKLLETLPEVTHICYGPRVEDVEPVIKEITLWSRLARKRVVQMVGGEVYCN